MANTTFVDSQTPVVASWLNDVNDLTYSKQFPDGSIALTNQSPVNPVDASEVSYLPSGSGAVETTVQNKLRQYVSVLDFGAVGDGVADDTAAIQAAINSCTIGNGFVYIPDGIYKITSTINIPNECTAIFSDNSTCKLLFTLASGDGFSALNRTRLISIHDLTFVTTTDTASAAIKVTTTGAYGKGLEIYNVEMRRTDVGCSWKYGIYIDGINDPWISNVFMEGKLAGEANISTNNLTGIYIISTKNAVTVSYSVSDVRVYGCDYGVRAVNTQTQGIEGLKFERCDFVHTRVCGFSCINNQSPTYVPPQVYLIGCHINTDAGQAVKIAQYSDIKLTDCTIYGNSSVNTVYLVEFEYCTNVQVIGNTIIAITDQTLIVPNYGYNFVINDNYLQIKSDGTKPALKVIGAYTISFANNQFNGTYLYSRLVDNPDPTYLSGTEFEGRVSRSIISNQISVNNTAAPSISISNAGTITQINANPGKIFTFINETTNVVTFNHVAKILLSGNTNYTLPQGGTITFMCYNNDNYCMEIART